MYKGFPDILLQLLDHQPLPPPTASTPGTTKPFLHPPPPPPRATKPFLHPPPPPPGPGLVKMNQTATVAHQSKCQHSSNVKM
ncbi:unnamed protein product [Arctogadus glacialis]